jgi:hypothetical protein
MFPEIAFGAKFTVMEFVPQPDATDTFGGKVQTYAIAFGIGATE